MWGDHGCKSHSRLGHQARSILHPQTLSHFAQLRLDLNRYDMTQNKVTLFCHRSDGHYLWFCQGWHPIKSEELVLSVQIWPFTLMKHCTWTCTSSAAMAFWSLFLGKIVIERHFPVLKGPVGIHKTIMPVMHSVLWICHTLLLFVGDWTAKSNSNDTSGYWGLLPFKRGLLLC